MKSCLQLFSLLTTLCLFSAAVAIAAAPPPTGPSRAGTDDSPMAAPLAEMMFYEAAEQAVQDGYATIVPDPDTKTEETEADKTEQPEKPTAPSAVELQN